MIRDTDIIMSYGFHGERREAAMPDWPMAWTFATFSRFLKPGPGTGLSFIDVGASCGAFCLAMMRSVEKWNALCIEPSEWSWPYLEANTKGLANVTLLHVAASDKRGTLRLSMPPVETGPRIGVESVYGSGKWAQDVEAYRLDDLVNEPVHLIKLDTEGHEMPILRGASRLIAEYHPDLLVEIKEVRQNPAGYKGHEVIRDIIRMGYGFPRALTHHDFLFEPER